MGHAFQSPMRRWDIVAGLCQAIDARTYVEVGCKDGRTTGFVLANCPNVRVIAIDPWCTQPESDSETYEDWDFEEIARTFWQNVGENKERVEQLRMRSAQAEFWLTQGRRWPDGSSMAPDVVFIDALHDWESVCIDIDLWWPLIREGGFLCGHDYNHKWPGLMRAVAARFPLMKVGLCPDSMWFVQKDSSVTLKAAA